MESNDSNSLFRWLNNTHFSGTGTCHFLRAYRRSPSFSFIVIISCLFFDFLSFPPELELKINIFCSGKTWEDGTKQLKELQFERITHLEYLKAAFEEGTHAIKEWQIRKKLLIKLSKKKSADRLTMFSNVFYSQLKLMYACALFTFHF